MIAYKLVRKRKDGSYGPLFINRRQRIQLGIELEAESHPTKGYAFRPGWHCTLKPEAPHLRTHGQDRVWLKVQVSDYEFFTRPASQGGTWCLAKKMIALEEIN